MGQKGIEGTFTWITGQFDEGHLITQVCFNFLLVFLGVGCKLCLDKGSLTFQVEHFPDYTALPISDSRTIVFFKLSVWMYSLLYVKTLLRAHSWSLKRIFPSSPNLGTLCRIASFIWKLSGASTGSGGAPFPLLVGVVAPGSTSESPCFDSGFVLSCRLGLCQPSWYLVAPKGGLGSGTAWLFS